MPTFSTLRFGDLDYRIEDVVTLPDGLVGMPGMRNWLLLDMGEDQSMKWFQSLERGDFGFPVTQPFFFLDDYQFDLSAQARDSIGNQEKDQLAVLIITTVHPGGSKVTGNMLAPLVIDTESRRGVQLTLEGDFDIRQEINYFKFGLALNAQAAENIAEVPEGTAAEAASSDSGCDEGSQESLSAETVSV